MPHAITTVLNIGNTNAERVQPAVWMEWCVKHLALHGPNPCKCQNFEGAIIWHFNTLGADFRREEHIPPTMRAVE